MQVRVEWRCFHCNEVFSDREKAQEHFGPTQYSEAACQLDIAEYRRMEENHIRHCMEDSDLHRELYAKNAEMAQAVRRAEESGYAKGVADAQTRNTGESWNDNGQPYPYRPGDGQW